MKKEKIGIGKLIGLLNEFETPHSGVVFKSYDDYDGTFYGVDIDGETEIAWSDSFVFGKRFKFIEWLVENDKIDLDKMEEKSEYTFIKNGGGEHIIEDVIMLLSISDEPIRFLCEIIK